MEKQFHNVHSVYDGLFNARSGVKVDINNPTLDMINIEDIAAGLSKICRFGGQIRHFYSVAQHSMLVADLAPREIRLEALLHDATEAYVGDVIKPLKVILGDTYKEIEDRFEAIICKKFGLDAEKLMLVKQFDKKALEYEHEFLQKGSGIDNWYGLWRKFESKGAYHGDFACWRSVAAEKLFYSYYTDCRFNKQIY